MEWGLMRRATVQEDSGRDGERRTGVRCDIMIGTTNKILLVKTNIAICGRPGQHRPINAASRHAPEVQSRTSGTYVMIT